MPARKPTRRISVAAARLRLRRGRQDRRQTEQRYRTKEHLAVLRRQRHGQMRLALAIGLFQQDERRLGGAGFLVGHATERLQRSEEHTSELQSLMRISYAVFCLKTKKQNTLNK